MTDPQCYWLTPARRELFEHNYPTHMKAADLYLLLSNLPGPLIPGIWALYDLAKRFGLKRPSTKPRPLNTQFSKEALASYSPSAFTQRTPVTWDQFVVEAQRHGVTVRDWEDMPKLNEAAEARGMTGFKRDFSRGRRRA